MTDSDFPAAQFGIAPLGLQERAIAGKSRMKRDSLVAPCSSRENVADEVWPGNLPWRNRRHDWLGDAQIIAVQFVVHTAALAVRS